METGVISRSYLLKRPPHPGPVKVLVDQSIIPAMIDAAATVELQIERIAARARRAPLLGVAAAFGVGWIASRMLRSFR